MSFYPTHCPACKADFDGGSVYDTLRSQAMNKEKTDDEVRADVKEFYGSADARWCRAIGGEDDNRVFHWECPDCKHSWVATL